MSSMIKKKGSLAFKPKVPISRPRPAASVSSAPTSESVDKPADKPLSTADTIPHHVASCLKSNASHLLQLEQSPSLGHHQVSPVEQNPPDNVVAEALESIALPKTQVPRQPDPPNLEPAVDNVSVLQTRSHRDVTIFSQVAPSLLPLAASAVASQSLDSTTTTTTTIPSPESILGQSEILTAEQESREATSSSAADAAATLQREPSISPATDVPATSTNQRLQRKKTRTVAEKGQGIDGAKTSGPKKRQRNTAKSRENTASRPRTRKREASDAAEEGSQSNKAHKRARSPTPEDAENHTVDLQQLTMADLTKDLRIGKKFSRHDELRNRERQLRVRARLGKEGEQPQGGHAASGSSQADPQAKSNSTTPASSEPPTSAPTEAATSGPQFRIVDGQIIVDQSSLVMDRHARAAATQQDLETVEENDFTRLTTSSSYRSTSKLKGPNVWTVEETELFYRGLGMFGTEFEMISKMFPGKHRRHVKLKFNREERHNPKRIDAALIGEKTTKMDIEEYRAFTGVEFQSVETIEAEQRKIQQDFEAQQQQRAKEQAEEMRKRREELFADDDANAKEKRGRKRFKQAVSYGLNGEPIVQPS
ncbi:hypothetical protein CDD82_1314 [Ophiocordyceps australis]|uniref:Myb-like domain-containing protein n=1 Tax=Ophiocordyceps australis TaxID=1399860 RepID=A0A2C5YSM0_9HYPO|nr:hypothetical protein CDD82_1314 [Ophiocordyceps australis]